MRLLSLDIGLRRTGVAFFDDATGIPLPLDTLRHASVGELLTQLSDILTSRRIEKIIVGLPLLPSGDEGAQVAEVRGVAQKLEEKGYQIVFVDERYTTPRSGASLRQAKHAPPRSDGDAAAACEILRTFVEKNDTKTSG